MTTRLLLPLLFVLTALLSACGSGGGNAGTSSATPTSTLTVTPALGKVRNAIVRALALDGHVLAQGTVDAQGKVTLQLPADGKPVVLELVGAAGAEYYDEGMEQWHALPSGTVLHAIRTGSDAEVTVTVLSEIVYRRALFLGGNSLNASVIAQARDDLHDLLSVLGMYTSIPAGFSLASPVQLVDGSSLIDASQPEGWHALLLAGIARHAFITRSMDDPACMDDPDCFPLAGAMDAVLTDLAEGRRSLPDMLDLVLGFVADGQVYNSRRLPAAENASVSVMAEIGNAFAGSYALACDGVDDPVQLRVLPSGEVALKGSMGSIWWGESSPLQANSRVSRDYRVTASGAAFALNGQHEEYQWVGDGDRKVLVADSGLAVNPDGRVAFMHAGTNYSCSGLPARSLPLTAFTQVMRAGNYACNGGATAVVTDSLASVSGTMLGSRDLTLASFSGYSHSMWPAVNNELGNVYNLESFTYQGQVPYAHLNLALTVSGLRQDGNVGYVMENFGASVMGLAEYACSYGGS